MVAPSKTYDILKTRMAQAMRNDPSNYYALTGTDINDLRALAMRFCEAPFNDPNETRDWQNRLFLMCDSAFAAGAIDPRLAQLADMLKPILDQVKDTREALKEIRQMVRELVFERNALQNQNRQLRDQLIGLQLNERTL